MAKRMMLLVPAVLVLALSATPAVSQPHPLPPGFTVDLVEVNPETPIHDVQISDWYELPVTSDSYNSWIIHADEDISELQFAAWDSDGYVLMGQMMPVFWVGFHTCTYEEIGGPPPVPPDQWRTFWQTLDVWNGDGLQECHYYRISIDFAPYHYDERMNLWIHPTPEPGCLVLIAAGGLALLGRRRWKSE